MSVTTDLPARPEMDPALRGGKRLLCIGVGLYTSAVIVPFAALLLFGENGIHVVAEFWSGLMLISPWWTLRGSNGARTLAGVIALLGAMATLPASCMVTTSEMHVPGIISLSLFPVLCFLTNIFLLNRKVQTYVASIRAGQGKSADHWSIGT